jgi:hypothetical protein
MKVFQMVIGAMLLLGTFVLAVTNGTNRVNRDPSTTMNVPSGVIKMPSGVITNMPSSVIQKPSGVIKNMPSSVITNPPDDTTGDATNQPAQTVQ